MTLDARVVVSIPGHPLDVALRAEPGRVLALLGPNGAGKSTVLRAIVGTVELGGGRIELDGRVLADPAGGIHVEPEHRHIGTVHQDLLLFPHLSALDNVAFGLRAAGRSTAEARRLAAERLEAVGLGDHRDHRPAALSGGQAQRVALARALAVEPSALLLDEPLSALDATVRAATRADLRRTLASFSGPTVLVTHDPVDALTLADDVVVVEQGAVVQAGTIAEVTTRPRSRHVADLVGTNLLRGTAHGPAVTVGAATVVLAEPTAGEVFLTISPSAVALATAEPEGSPRNRWPVVVSGIEPSGERIRVALDGPVPLVAEITVASLASLGLQVGDAVWASVKATEVRSYPR